MSYGPPLPRKPASYSPTFLAAQQDDYFGAESAQWDSRRRSREGSYGVYGRDTAIDDDFRLEHAGQRSRPLSGESAGGYGRPLPLPPMSMPFPGSMSYADEHYLPADDAGFPAHQFDHYQSQRHFYDEPEYINDGHDQTLASNGMDYSQHGRDAPIRVYGSPTYMPDMESSLQHAHQGSPYYSEAFEQSGDLYQIESDHGQYQRSYADQDDSNPAFHVGARIYDTDQQYLPPNEPPYGYMDFPIPHNDLGYADSCASSTSDIADQSTVVDWLAIPSALPIWTASEGVSRLPDVVPHTIEKSIMDVPNRYKPLPSNPVVEDYPPEHSAGSPLRTTKGLPPLALPASSHLRNYPSHLQSAESSDFKNTPAEHGEIQVDPHGSSAIHSRYESSVISSRTTPTFTRSNTVSEQSKRRAPLYHSLTTPVSRQAVPLPAIEIDFTELASADYDKCANVWSRRCLFRWLQTLDIATEDSFIKACSGLFAHTVPTLSKFHTQKLARDLLASYMHAGEVIRSDDGNGDLSFATDVGEGILPTFTNGGCYSNKCHTNFSSCRCYSSRCSRTIPIKHERPKLDDISDHNDWAAYWGLSKDKPPLSYLDIKEVQRQYQIHEVIYSEVAYLQDLSILRDVFGRTLLDTSHQDKDFFHLLFGKIPHLIELSERHLLLTLQERQAQEGPVIEHIGDLFLSWVKKAGPVYIEYAAQMGYADRAVRSQRARNPVVQAWLKTCEAHPATKKLDFSSFQGCPTRRMQRYALLLGDVLRKSSETSPDYSNLQQAITEIKAICQVCNTQVSIAQDKIALLDLSQRLIWRTSPKDLGLDDSKREIRFRGDLQRKSEAHTSWQSREVILLDNFLLCIKPSKDGAQKVLSRAPIPMDYLIVEDSEEVLYKSSSSKLIGGTITHTVQQNEPTTRRATMETLNSTLSSATMVSPSKAAAENLYPFSVRHGGRPEEKITFYAESAAIRTTWIAAIRSARAARWQKVAHREPFKVKLVSEQDFGNHVNYTTSASIKSPVEPTNIVESELNVSRQSLGKSVSIARVQCITMFLDHQGTEVYFIGSDDGVYAKLNDTWTRVIPIARVTQLAVLEEFGVLTVLADKTLIAYNVDDVLRRTGTHSSSRPPQRLSGHKSVGFFEVGLLKGRMLVIYKRKDNSNSVFKALEPVIGKKQEKKSFFKKASSAGGTDFFRDFDEFFIPTDCYGMQYLRSTICIKCARGFEVMSLDSKQPVTIPDLSNPRTAMLRTRISGAKPLGTYRVQEGEFLCCYAECGIFVDPSGSISRPYTLEWEGRPDHAVLVGAYVVAIGREFIEVWDIEKRSLRQVITGMDMRCIPCSSAGGSIDTAGRGILIAMNHPYKANKQVVFELQLR